MKWTYTIIQICGLIVCLIGLATLFKYILGGIPKMAILTAIAFTIEGFVIVLIGTTLKEGKWVK